MNFYFDTSALIKKYILEKGSDVVDNLFDKADIVFLSSISEIEIFSTFKRLLIEKDINAKEHKFLKSEFETDYQYFSVINFDEYIAEHAKTVIEKYQLKSLDSIQLGTALLVKDKIDSFIVCDQKLINAAKKEGIDITNPIK